MVDIIRVISPASTSHERSRPTELDCPDSDFVRNYVSFPGLDSQVSDVTVSDLDSSCSDSHRGAYRT
jgi:hypothetical protein